MLYPLKFRPIFQERVWGGRNLERLYNKKLPPNTLVGESWEISDRPEAVSELENGPLAGKNLHWLMQEHGSDLLGEAKADNGKFPLLIKILDAQEKLSLQVHPPAKVAKELGGEPKTEMWYIADATPEAALYVGLKEGITRAQFEQAIRDGTVADLVNRIPVKAGDVMFLPSGRLHAIGGGNVIFEIQQNSDTTYRVFDWNRPGTDGKPRQLHVSQSLASIDFNDFEPSLIQSKYSRNPVMKVRYLVDNPLFRVDACQVKRGQRFYLSGPVVQVVGIIRGRLKVGYGEHQLEGAAGEFILLPACLERVTFVAETQIEFLHIQAGSE